MPVRLPMTTAIFCLLESLAAAQPLITFRTRTAVFAFDARGSLCALRVQGRDVLAPDQAAPLLSLRVDGRLLAPTGATWDGRSRRLSLAYPGATAVVSVTARPTHLALEIAEVRAAGRIEFAQWGPYPTSIGDLIGETVGVVRDPSTAVGIQALNARTLGGSPVQDDAAPDFTADDPGHYPDLPAELRKNQLFRGDTARRTPFGSVLQAYCRDRTIPRTITNWERPGFPVPPLDDGGLVGSRIALFGCPATRVLDTLGAIELAEGLPHPMLDGVWAKIAPQATAAYLIVDFDERSIGKAIETTRRAGLRYLYHSSPFKSWGHFDLKPDAFPRGWDGLKACADEAHRAGIRVGIHTLSNFITTDDAYATPKPDPRLAQTGASTLAGAVEAESKALPVASLEPFRKPSELNTVRIGEELIQYQSVSTEAPWRLLGCTRGAFGTRPAAHGEGTAVGKLMDHGYKVFLTNAELSTEVARTLARVCNHAGIQQISLDGLEGNDSTGHGDYGRTFFTQAWRDALDPRLRDTLINDASRACHFTWHTTTRMNWGEPWYAGFRESQTLLRFQNQFYFARNLMPRMLGWFSLRPETSLEDAEWMLARSAGFDAGFALAMSHASTAQLDAAKGEEGRSGAVPAILEAVKQWEAARMAGAFPPEARARLRDNQREFHLVAAGPRRWTLFEVQTARFPHTGVASQHAFENRMGRQPLCWDLASKAARDLEGVTLEVDGRAVAALSMPLPAGGHLHYTGGAEAVLYDAAWKELGRCPVDPRAGMLGKGSHTLQVRCSTGEGAALTLEARTLGPGQPLRARR